MKPIEAPPLQGAVLPLELKSQQQQVNPPAPERLQGAVLPLVFEPKDVILTDKGGVYHKSTLNLPADLQKVLLHDVDDAGIVQEIMQTGQVTNPGGENMSALEFLTKLRDLKQNLSPEEKRRFGVQ